MEVLAQLGIDLNSVVVYVINFGLLLAATAYFVTGPLLRMMDKRRATIENNLNEAERIKQEFMEEKQKADAEKEALRIEMEQQMSELKKELEHRRKEQEEKLELKKAKMLEEVRTIVDEEKSKILSAAENQTIKLIEKVVLHVVSNNVPEDVVKTSVDQAWKEFSQQ